MCVCRKEVNVSLWSEEVKANNTNYLERQKFPITVLIYVFTTVMQGKSLLNNGNCKQDVSTTAVDKCGTDNSPNSVVKKPRLQQLLNTGNEYKAMMPLTAAFERRQRINNILRRLIALVEEMVSLNMSCSEIELINLSVTVNSKELAGPSLQIIESKRLNSSQKQIVNTNACLDIAPSCSLPWEKPGSKEQNKKSSCKTSNEEIAKSFDDLVSTEVPSESVVILKKMVENQHKDVSKDNQSTKVTVVSAPTMKLKPLQLLHDTTDQQKSSDKENDDDCI
ncbi:uncharacterized protein LOC119689425 [Teleopsis dalmanni]|uniref:uncharacterized protein LOC119689425 n=1 Tax=Teleopsis dalmanni TaxID=139649 RepID=UPI0018CF3DDF|nr:uncharacterized protein LOC119689425 [Teleopsis dalmanni]